MFLRIVVAAFVSPFGQWVLSETELQRRICDPANYTGFHMHILRVLKSKLESSSHFLPLQLLQSSSLQVPTPIIIIMGFLWSLASHLHTLAGPLVMLLYPLYASVKAIESESKEDDQQWLTYWILYSSLTFLEIMVAPVFTWIPLWSSLKLIWALWLVLPPFKGAHHVYDWVIRRHLLKQQVSLTRSLSDSQRKFLDLLSPQARESLERHLEEHGTNALDNIIAAANKETYKNPFALGVNPSNQVA